MSSFGYLSTHVQSKHSSLTKKCMPLQAKDENEVWSHTYAAFMGEDGRFLYILACNAILYIIDTYLDIQTIITVPFSSCGVPKGWIDKNNRLHIIFSYGYVSKNNENRSYLRLDFYIAEFDQKFSSLKKLKKERVNFDFDDKIYHAGFESSNRGVVFSTKYKRLLVYSTENLSNPLATFEKMPQFLYGYRPKLLASIDNTNKVLYSNVSLCIRPVLSEILVLDILTGKRESVPINLTLFDEDMLEVEFPYIKQFLKNDYLYFNVCKPLFSDFQSNAHFFKLNVWSKEFVRFKVQMLPNIESWIFVNNFSNGQLKLVGLGEKQQNKMSRREIYITTLSSPQSLKTLTMEKVKKNYPNVVHSMYSKRFKNKVENWWHFFKAVFIYC